MKEENYYFQSSNPIKGAYGDFIVTPKDKKEVLFYRLSILSCGLVFLTSFYIFKSNTVSFTDKNVKLVQPNFSHLEKWDKKKEVCNLNDLSLIVRGQIKLENEAIRSAKKFVFCDTNILVTKIWAETHFDGYCPPEIEKYSENFHYDYYSLTAIDVPWQADDLRDRPNNREEMFNYFKNQFCLLYTSPSPRDS